MDETTPTKVYGNFIVGIWLCLRCHTRYFPKQIRDLGTCLDWAEVKPGHLHPRCPGCQSVMVYDEEE